MHRRKWVQMPEHCAHEVQSQQRRLLFVRHELLYGRVWEMFKRCCLLVPRLWPYKKDAYDSQWYRMLLVR